MRITAIRNYEPGRAVSKMNHKRNAQTNVMHSHDTGTKADTVSFKAHETVKGFGIGALVGLGALTILSGGAAAPLICGVYAAASGVAGGMLGKAIEDTNKKDSEDKKN